MLHKEVNYTVNQVSQILNCSRQTVINLIKAGDMKAFKVGSDYRIRESALKEFMEKE
jgi:excisionase family DNA binding protein